MTGRSNSVNLPALAASTLIGLELCLFFFYLSMCLMVDKSDPKWQGLAEGCISSAAIFVLSVGALAVLSTFWLDKSDERL